VSIEHISFLTGDLIKAREDDTVVFLSGAWRFMSTDEHAIFIIMQSTDFALGPAIFHKALTHRGIVSIDLNDWERV